MLHALVLLAWIACTPAADWPTPALEWDHSLLPVQTDGYRVYVRDPGEAWPAWQLAADLPTWWDEDEFGNPTSQHRYGLFTDLLWPIQRADVPEGVWVEWMVRAYNIRGESGDSNVFSFCTPYIWQPGEAYQ